MAGSHSFYRGCHPSVYGHEVARSLQILDGQIDTAACRAIWQNGMTSAWAQAPVWVHGDVAAGNILMAGTDLTALIDFGACAVGDPACDLVMGWTFFDARTRPLFRAAVQVDDATWHRARAWALWKALVTLSGLSSPDTNGMQARALRQILSDDS